MSGISMDQYDPKALGARIVSARRSAGLTQNQIADQTGISRTTLVGIEKGERRVQPDQIVRLAAALSREVYELVGDDPLEEGFAVQLRAVLAKENDTLGQIQPQLVEFEALCQAYRDLERLAGEPRRVPFAPHYDIDGLPVDVLAEDIADRERRRLGLGDGPLPDLRALLDQEVGLPVFCIELPSHVSGWFAFAPSAGGCIAVNRKHPEERRRMTMAHEFGHFLTARKQPEVVRRGQYQRQPGHERFAGRFAMAFLMPELGLRRRFNDMKRHHGGRLTPASLLLMADDFQVSLEAIMLRLELLGLIQPGNWEALRREGLSVREDRSLLGLSSPSGDDHIAPLRYRYLAVTAYERGDLSEEQLAHYLRTDRLGARELRQKLACRSDLSSDMSSFETMEIPLVWDISH